MRQSGENATATLEDLKQGLDDFFLITNAIFIAFMQAGFACLESGSIRTKNVVNIFMKNVLDTFISGISYYLIGYTLAFEDGNSFIGYSRWVGYGLEDSKISFWFFQFVFASTASTILSGAVAERCSFIAYLIYSFCMSGIVYPVVTHWVWYQGGWLNLLGYKDFAGGSLVHALAGTASLVAAIIIGPRTGRFTNGRINEISGHSLPLVGLGILLLLCGMLGYNGGCVGHISQPGDGIQFAKTVMNTVLAGSGAAAGSLFLGKIGLYGTSPWPFSLTVNAIFSGMVSVCVGANIYAGWAAILCGAIAALVYYLLHKLFLYLRVDDPLDSAALHMGGGCWGVFAKVLLSEGGVFYVRNNVFELVLYNVVAIVSIVCWAAACSFIIFGGLHYFGKLRVSKEEEMKGLDISKHGELSYPHSAWGNSDETVEARSEDRDVNTRETEYNNRAFQIDSELNKDGGFSVRL